MDRFFSFLSRKNRFSVSKIGPEPAKPTISLALLHIILGNHSSKCFSTMCCNFPQKSEQSQNTENNICLDLCGKLLHIVE